MKRNTLNDYEPTICWIFRRFENNQPLNVQAYDPMAITRARLAEVNWVVAFCDGAQWCSLIQQNRFRTFLAQELLDPVERMYDHSFPVPPLLDNYCQELYTYETEVQLDYTIYDLAIGHLSLSMFFNGVRLDPLLASTRIDIRRELVKVAIFYHLLFHCPPMHDWCRTEMLDSLAIAGERGFKFVWQKMEKWFQNAESHMLNVFNLCGMTALEVDRVIWPKIVQEMWPFIRANCIVEHRRNIDYRQENGLRMA